MLPEIAVISLHGGGNGRIIEAFADENRATRIFSVERNGEVLATRFRSNRVGITIAPDDAVSLPLNAAGGYISFHCQGATSLRGLVFFRAGVGVESIVAVDLGVDTATTTGPLTGTTGAVGKFTVSIDGTNLVFENRVGVSRNVYYTVLA